uniref:Uncharacterized protein n=1 Tax=Romanomermis culicivorax TaxID=13658 RepID=A0A915HP82_ROMCU
MRSFLRASVPRRDQQRSAAVPMLGHVQRAGLLLSSGLRPLLSIPILCYRVGMLWLEKIMRTIFIVWEILFKFDSYLYYSSNFSQFFHTENRAK